MNSSKWRTLEDAPMEIRTKYEILLQQVDSILQLNGFSPLEQASAAGKVCRSSMFWLRQYMQEHPFSRREEEIQFFKHIKPVFQQEYLYWMGLFEGWLNFPVGGWKSVKKYVHQQLEFLAHIQQQHSSFFHYWRLGYSDRDVYYFTRQSDAEEDLLDPLGIERDRQWSTGYDLLVARFLSSERLQAFWQQIGKRSGGYTNSTSTDRMVFPLRWTASKAALVELIYALQTSGVYNHGQVDLKQLAELFSRYFQIDLGNFYHVFNEIRLRKKNRTQLLDLLKDKVVAKMDELDVR